MKRITIRIGIMLFAFVSLFLWGCSPLGQETGSVTHQLTPTATVTAGGTQPATPTQNTVSASTATPTTAPRSTPNPSPTPAQSASESAVKAPDFVVQELTGETYRLSDLQGSIVLLNFWTTWCGYCRTERASLQQAFERHSGDGFVVLAVSLQESEETVRGFVQQQNLTFPVMIDVTGDIQRAYGIRGIPTSFFIDSGGFVVGRHVGPLTLQAIEQVLAGMN